jgi:hypothetical protein
MAVERRRRRSVIEAWVSIVPVHGEPRADGVSKAMEALELPGKLSKTIPTG